VARSKTAKSRGGHATLRWSHERSRWHANRQRLAALKKLGNAAAAMLRRRVEKQGRHAGGRLPDSDSDDWWWTSARDRRWAGINLAARFSKKKHGRGRKPDLAVSLPGYAAFKRQIGGKSLRGQSLTGAAWRSLTVKIKGDPGRRLIQVYFKGSVVLDEVELDGKRKKIRFQNRNKMTLAQYRKRSSGGRRGSGRPDFLLMALTRAEVGELANILLRSIRLFR